MAKTQKPNPNQGQNRDISQGEANRRDQDRHPQMDAENNGQSGGQGIGEQQNRQQHAENFIQGRERASDLRPSQQGGENFLQGRERASDFDKGRQR